MNAHAKFTADTPIRRDVRDMVDRTYSALQSEIVRTGLKCAHDKALAGKYPDWDTPRQMFNQDRAVLFALLRVRKASRRAGVL